MRWGLGAPAQRDGPPPEAGWQATSEKCLRRRSGRKASSLGPRPLTQPVPETNGTSAHEISFLLWCGQAVSPFPNTRRFLRMKSIRAGRPAGFRYISVQPSWPMVRTKAARFRFPRPPAFVPDRAKGRLGTWAFRPARRRGSELAATPPEAHQPAARRAPGPAAVPPDRRPTKAVAGAFQPERSAKFPFLPWRESAPDGPGPAHRQFGGRPKKRGPSFRFGRPPTSNAETSADSAPRSNGAPQVFHPGRPLFQPGRRRPERP